MINAVKVLDLGCGNNKRVGALGIDFNSTTPADVIHDVFPYPLDAVRLHFSKIQRGEIVFNETLVNRWTKKLVLKLAIRWSSRYEYYFSHFYRLDDVQSL